MNVFDVVQGDALAVEVELKDEGGVRDAGWDGTQGLASTLWPGGAYPASCPSAATWTDPQKGLIRVDLAAASTATLAPGRYLLRVVLTDGGVPSDCYLCAVQVAQAPGTAAAPKCYVDYPTLRGFAGPWLRTLESAEETAGFLDERGRASDWVDDLAHAHFRVASMVMVVGGLACGPRISGARSTWLQDQLDKQPTALMVRGTVKEACAKHALALIAEKQADGDPENNLARLARMYRRQAESLASCLTIELDTDGDGWADVTIDCSSVNPLYG